MIIHRLVAALFAAPILLATSSAERPLSASERAQITLAIEAKLVDPASAQFRMGSLRPASEYYCGLVNARNRMGGYNGFEPFMVRFNPDRTTKIAVLPDPKDREMEQFWRAAIRETCTREGYSTEY